MREISLNAPAKVNTLLRVVGRRPDGYHDLQMVMVPLTLADDVSLTRIPSGIELDMEGQSDDGMRAERNLCWKAARAVIEAHGLEEGVRIRLRKRIPVAAGLGGGSSDAAAVLKGMNGLFELGLTADGLARLGSGLGADVPFFCHGGPAFVEGTGDRISAYDSFPNLSFLLINPGFAVSTPWVYKQWDLQLTGPNPGVRVRPLFQVLSEVIASLHNDLERVTIPQHPEIAVIKDALLEAGASGALMSGSGPTVFGIFKDGKARDGAFEELDAGRWRVFKVDSAGDLSGR